VAIDKYGIRHCEFETCRGNGYFAMNGQCVQNRYLQNSQTQRVLFGD
jgi:hypothetical protein